MAEDYQIQQQRSSVFPTVVGLGLGAGAGYGVNRMMSKPSDASWDSEVEKMNNADEYVKKMQEEGISEDIQTKYKNTMEEIKTAEKEWDEAKAKFLEEHGAAGGVQETEEFKALVKAHEEKLAALEAKKQTLIEDAVKQLEQKNAVEAQKALSKLGNLPVDKQIEKLNEYKQLLESHKTSQTEFNNLLKEKGKLKAMLSDGSTRADINKALGGTSYFTTELDKVPTRKEAEELNRFIDEDLKGAVGEKVIGEDYAKTIANKTAKETEIAEIKKRPATNLAEQQKAAADLKRAEAELEQINKKIAGYDKKIKPLMNEVEGAMQVLSRQSDAELTQSFFNDLESLKTDKLIKSAEDEVKKIEGELAKNHSPEELAKLTRRKELLEDRIAEMKTMLKKPSGALDPAVYQQQLDRLKQQLTDASKNLKDPKKVNQAKKDIKRIQGEIKRLTSGNNGSNSFDAVIEKLLKNPDDEATLKQFADVTYKRQQNLEGLKKFQEYYKQPQTRQQLLATWNHFDANGNFTGYTQQMAPGQTAVVDFKEVINGLSKEDQAFLKRQLNKTSFDHIKDPKVFDTLLESRIALLEEETATARKLRASFGAYYGTKNIPHEVQIPESKDLQKIQKFIFGDKNVKVLSPEEIRQKAVETVEKGKGLATEIAEEANAKKLMEEARANLPKVEGKVEEDVIKEFIEKHGERDKIAKEKLGGLKDDLAKMWQKAPGKGKMAMIIGGGAILGGIIGHALSGNSNA